MLVVVASGSRRNVNVRENAEDWLSLERVIDSN